MTSCGTSRLIDGLEVRSAMSVVIEGGRVVVDRGGRFGTAAECYRPDRSDRGARVDRRPLPFHVRPRPEPRIWSADRHRHGEAPRPRELGYFVLAASAQAIVRSGFHDDP